jgi:hypothetical protein
VTLPFPALVAESVKILGCYLSVPATCIGTEAQHFDRHLVRLSVHFIQVSTHPAGRRWRLSNNRMVNADDVIKDGIIEAPKCAKYSHRYLPSSNFTNG